MAQKKIEVVPQQGDKLTTEDYRWAVMVRQAIVGLAAQADMQCEGCDIPWLAMHYSLESIREVMDAIVDDYKQRLGVQTSIVDTDGKGDEE